MPCGTVHGRLAHRGALPSWMFFTTIAPEYHGVKCRCASPQERGAEPQSTCLTMGGFQVPSMMAWVGQ